MDIVNAYAAVGTFRGAAALCGTTHKTVKRVLERRQAGQLEPRAPRTSNTVVVDALIDLAINARLAVGPPAHVLRRFSPQWVRLAQAA
jgi:hypothetical protein